MKPQRPRKLSASGAAAFRKRGFRKWYERELLGSHAELLLAGHDPHADASPPQGDAATGLFPTGDGGIAPAAARHANVA